MDYYSILKEIEPKVRIHQVYNMDYVEDMLHHTLHSRFTEEECYPIHGKNPVSLFTQMLHQKYPTEYKKKVLQWISHVVGAWVQPTPSELRSQLENWVKNKITAYRECLEVDEPESEEEEETHAEYTRLGDISRHWRR